MPTEDEPKTSEIKEDSTFDPEKEKGKLKIDAEKERQARKDAIDLYDALKDAGTGEAKLKSILEGIKNKEELERVKRHFKQYTNQTLTDYIKEDSDWDQKTRIEAMSLVSKLEYGEDGLQDALDCIDALSALSPWGFRVTNEEKLISTLEGILNDDNKKIAQVDKHFFNITGSHLRDMVASDTSGLDNTKTVSDINLKEEIDKKMSEADEKITKATKEKIKKSKEVLEISEAEKEKIRSDLFKLDVKVKAGQSKADAYVETVGKEAPRVVKYMMSFKNMAMDKAVIMSIDALDPAVPDVPETLRKTLEKVLPKGTGREELLALLKSEKADERKIGIEKLQKLNGYLNTCSGNIYEVQAQTKKFDEKGAEAWTTKLIEKVSTNMDTNPVTTTAVLLGAAGLLYCLKDKKIPILYDFLGNFKFWGKGDKGEKGGKDQFTYGDAFIMLGAGFLANEGYKRFISPSGKGVWDSVKGYNKFPKDYTGGILRDSYKGTDKNIIRNLDLVDGLAGISNLPFNELWKNYDFAKNKKYTNNPSERKMEMNWDRYDKYINVDKAKKIDPRKLYIWMENICENYPGGDDAVEKRFCKAPEGGKRGYTVLEAINLMTWEKAVEEDPAGADGIVARATGKKKDAGSGVEEEKGIIDGAKEFAAGIFGDKKKETKLGAGVDAGILYIEDKDAEKYLREKQIDLKLQKLIVLIDDADEKWMKELVTKLNFSGEVKDNFWKMNTALKYVQVGRTLQDKMKFASTPDDKIKIKNEYLDRVAQEIDSLYNDFTQWNNRDKWMADGMASNRFNAFYDRLKKIGFSDAYAQPYFQKVNDFFDKRAYGFDFENIDASDWDERTYKAYALVLEAFNVRTCKLSDKATLNADETQYLDYVNQHIQDNLTILQGSVQVGGTLAGKISSALDKWVNKYADNIISNEELESADVGVKGAWLNKGKTFPELYIKTFDEFKKGLLDPKIKSSTEAVFGDSSSIAKSTITGTIVKGEIRGAPFEINTATVPPTLTSLDLSTQSAQDGYLSLKTEKLIADPIFNDLDTIFESTILGNIKASPPISDNFKLLNEWKTLVEFKKQEAAIFYKESFKKLPNLTNPTAVITDIQALDTKLNRDILVPLNNIASTINGSKRLSGQNSTQMTSLLESQIKQLKNTHYSTEYQTEFKSLEETINAFPDFEGSDFLGTTTVFEVKNKAKKLFAEATISMQDLVIDRTVARSTVNKEKYIFYVKNKIRECLQNADSDGLIEASEIPDTLAGANIKRFDDPTISTELNMLPDPEYLRLFEKMRTRMMNIEATVFVMMKRNGVDVNDIKQFRNFIVTSRERRITTEYIARLPAYTANPALFRIQLGIDNVVENFFLKIDIGPKVKVTPYNINLLTLTNILKRDGYVSNTFSF